MYNPVPWFKTEKEKLEIKTKLNKIILEFKEGDKEKSLFLSSVLEYVGDLENEIDNLIELSAGEDI